MASSKSVEALEAENAALKATVAELTGKVTELNEECDLLSFRNEMLENELKELKSGQSRHSASPGSNSNAASSTAVTVEMDTSAFACQQDTTLYNASGDSCNVLCVSYHEESQLILCGGTDKALKVYDASGNEANDAEEASSLPPSSAKSLRLNYLFHAPVLSINIVPRPVCGDSSSSAYELVAACAMMDGSLGVVTITSALVGAAADSGVPTVIVVHKNDDEIHTDGSDSTGDAATELSPPAAPVSGSDANAANSVQLFCNHAKYAVACAWSPECSATSQPAGQFLATASYDKTVNIYKRVGACDGGAHRMQLAQKINFESTPESVVFALVRGAMPSASTAAAAAVGGAEDVDITLDLIIALRDVCTLTYITCGSSGADSSTTFSSRKVSLNENEWDTHVSFTPLFLSVSPDFKYLAVSTNHSLHYCYLTGTNTRVRTFVGYVSNDYSKPRTCWGPGGGNGSMESLYLYSNTDESNSILVYSLASDNVLHTLHSKLKTKTTGGMIKDLSPGTSKCGTIVAASMNRTVTLWKTK